MKYDPERVLVNVRQASTDDLLDRVTVFRQGMEQDALLIIEDELHRRGVTAAQIAEHRERSECVRAADGLALGCSLCRRPAVAQRWRWHRLFGLIPLFPRRFRYCAEHDPGP